MRSFLICLHLITFCYAGEGFWSNCGSTEYPLSFWFEEAKKRPTFHYPNSNLIEELQKEGITSLTLFAYGSLLDYDSASRTLTDESIQTGIPAIALGARRLFNRDVPIIPNSHWGEPVSPLARGMLNLECTDNEFDIVNGLTITLSLVELSELCKREVGYDLVPIVCTQWRESATSIEPYYCIVYTLSAPRNSIYVSSEILPRPGYYELTRDAAKPFGLLYYYLWMNTTSIANEDSITEWERAVQAGEDKTLIFY